MLDQRTKPHEAGSKRRRIYRKQQEKEENDNSEKKKAAVRPLDILIRPRPSGSYGIRKRAAALKSPTVAYAESERQRKAGTAKKQKHSELFSFVAIQWL